MELAQTTNVEGASRNLGSASKMGVDDEQLGMMFQTLRSGMYSQPIMSIVREVSTNCLDAIIERDEIKEKTGDSRWLSDDPNFYITFHDTDYDKEVQRHIVFKDTGVGLSPDRMENVYKKYFTSTKRNTNNLMGGFGLIR